MLQPQNADSADNVIAFPSILSSLEKDFTDAPLSTKVLFLRAVSTSLGEFDKDACRRLVQEYVYGARTWVYAHRWIDDAKTVWLHAVLQHYSLSNGTSTLQLFDVDLETRGKELLDYIKFCADEWLPGLMQDFNRRVERLIEPPDERT